MGRSADCLSKRPSHFMVNISRNDTGASGQALKESTLRALSVSFDSLNPVRVTLAVSTNGRNMPVEGMKNPGLSGKVDHTTLSLAFACHSWDAVC